MIVPEIIKIAARNLRNNMRKAEVELWSHIKNKSIWARFMRQKPIYVYTENSWHNRFIIADFYCAEKQIVIELDWGIHLQKEVLQLDQEKEDLLENKEIKVLRFENEEIFNNIKWVLEKIKNYK
jgi:imidazole glycerol-phosphate synthase subunit HisF